MSQFYRCDRCGEELKDQYVLIFQIGPRSILEAPPPSKVWDLCSSCKNDFQLWQIPVVHPKEPRP
jgi:hypothetical protein